MRKLTLCSILSITATTLCASTESQVIFPIPTSNYPTQNPEIINTIIERAQFAPFNVFVTLIFFCAVFHTLFFAKFLDISEKLKKKSEQQKSQKLFFLSKLFHLFGEVEAIFALWLIPLFFGYLVIYGWENLSLYLDNLTFKEAKYVEPIFVVVIMSIAATRPIIQLSSDIINVFAKIGGGKVAAWWVSILIVGPLLGSLITEPAAITICAALLSENFYKNNPSTTFKYATLGALLATISIGGTFTHFSAPPVLMVASAWDWNTPFMLANFGWKAALGILFSVIIYAFMFRKEFAKMQHNTEANPLDSKRGENRIPWQITTTHVGFLIFTVFTLHHPALFIFAFLLFLAFVDSTREYQSEVNIKTPLLVGLFLAALVTHGSLQAWWIEPLLNNLGEGEIFLGTIALSAFNDNAAITYLATLAPDFSQRMQYLIVAAAVASGGLTIIANAPNPAGVAILKKHFGERVSPIKLLAGAALPTIIMATFLYFF